MRRDPTLFRERFKAYKNGKMPYKAGKILPEFEGGTSPQITRVYKPYRDKDETLIRNVDAQLPEVVITNDIHHKDWSTHRDKNGILLPDYRSSFQQLASQKDALYAANQYLKAKDDAKREKGFENLMKLTAPSTYGEAITGKDFGTVGRLAFDVAAFGLPGLTKRGIRTVPTLFKPSKITANNTRLSIGTEGFPYYYNPTTKLWDFTSASNDVKAGIQDLKDWMNSPIYRLAAKTNRAEAEAMGLEYVPYYERPEYTEAIANPNIKYLNLGSPTIGGLSSSVGEIIINTTTPQNPIQVVRHELGHVAGLGNISKESTVDFMNHGKKQLQYLRYKADQVFKEGSEYAGQVDLNRNAFEGILNARDFGVDLGIKVGLEYPGYEKALEIINSYPDKGFKSGLKNMFRLDKEHMQYVWKALNGTLFSAIPFALGGAGLGIYGTASLLKIL